jgi:hypothetical protein
MWEALLEGRRRECKRKEEVEVGGLSKKVLSRKNMAPSFEVSEHKETCVPGLSGQKRGGKAKRFYRTYIRSY